MPGVLDAEGIWRLGRAGCANDRVRDITALCLLS